MVFKSSGKDFCATIEKKVGQDSLQARPIPCFFAAARSESYESLFLRSLK